VTVVLPELSAVPGARCAADAGTSHPPAASSARPPGPPALRAGVVDPLPLPAAAWGEEQARDAIQEAALVLPELMGQARLVRALATVVFRIGGLAVKVHPPGTDPLHLAQVHTVLGAAPVAATSAHPPVVTSSGVVSVAPWLVSGPAPRRAAWSGLGEALRTLHDHPDAERLPSWVPLRRLPAQLEHVDLRSAARLATARAWALDELAELPWLLPPGALHGDVSPDNVLRTPEGLRWIDLDFSCYGRREYDLSAVVRRRASGQLSERDYRAFCRSYGADLVGWPGLRLLDDVCALSGLGFRLWLDRRAGRPSHWLPVELDRLSERVPAAR
jgi:hypothetical protein